MRVLVRHGITCPMSIVRKQCTLDCIEAMMNLGFTEEDVANLLAQLYRSMSACDQVKLDRHKLLRRVESAELLGVLQGLAMHEVLAVNGVRLLLIGAVQAARKGSASQLERILSQDVKDNFDIYTAEFHGLPLLFQPLIDCANDWLDRMKVLLKYGANVNALYRKWGCSALHMLLYDKEQPVPEMRLVEAVHSLVEGGIELNSVDTEGRTPAIQAATGGHIHVCRSLLQIGADPTVCDKYNCTMFEYLFYLKHSYTKKDRRRTRHYACSDLARLVTEFNVEVSDEVRFDSLDCRECRFVLGIHSDSSMTSPVDTEERQTE